MRVLEKAAVTSFNRYRNDFIEAGYRDYLNTVPFVNIIENKESYQINFAVPGMKKEDFRITLDGNAITVSCNCINREAEDAVTWARSEFNYSSFSRSFTLPDYVSGDKLMARYDNGILKLNLPKKLGYGGLSRN